MLNKLNFLKLDLRSLALARVALAFVLIVDLLYRLMNLTDFYTDYGIIPRGAMLTQFASPYFFSLLFAAGKSFYIYLLFLLGFVFYLGMFFGYRTKISTIGAWVFFVSLSARTPIITQAGDDLMRLALFWMIFLPAENYFSMDAALLNFEKGSKTERPQGLLNISSLALMLQLVIMYVFTALLKWHPIWHTEGSALYYALELDQFLTTLGMIFRQLPQEILRYLSFGTLYAELIIPLLLFFPYKNYLFRWLGIVTFVGFHFSLFLFFELGNFPWVCMAYWLVFIPGNFWSAWDQKLKSRQTGVKLYYDPDCGICRKMCAIIETFLILKYVEVKPGSDPEILQKIREKNSWVVQDQQGRYHFSYSAFLALFKVSVFKKLLFIFDNKFSSSIGEFIYFKVSNDRKNKLHFFTKLKYRKYFDADKFWIQAVVTVFFITALYWNVALFKKDDDIKLPHSIDVIGSVFRLHQFWTMFAPFPAMEDGWVITEAELFNGKKWDIFNNKEVDFEKPAMVSKMFKNTLWRKYLINLRQKSYNDYRLYFGRYLCRKWNGEHQGDQQVNNFKIYYILEKSQAFGSEKKPLEHEMLWSHGCFIK